MAYDAASRAVSVPAVEPDRVRVFVVDDHELFRNGLCDLLAGAGMEVVGEAGDAESVCAAAPSLTPDVVVMDLDLPGMPAVEAIRRLERSVPAAKVIAFAMAADGSAVTEAVAAGVRGYLLKDAPADEIVAAVRAAAAGLSPVSARAAGALFERVRAVAGARDGDDRPALTPRELEVLVLLVDGKSNSEIADLLHISPPTVKHHIASILEKLGVENRIQAAVRAVRSGLV